MQFAFDFEADMHEAEKEAIETGKAAEVTFKGGRVTYRHSIHTSARGRVSCRRAFKIDGKPYLSMPRWRHSASGTPVGHPVTHRDVLEERRRIITHKKEGTPPAFSKAPTPERPYSKYRKDVSGLDEIDVYDLCELFAIDDPSGATQHAIKKLLLSGQRTGGKAASVDIAEAIDSLKRAQALAKRREA